MILFLFSIYLIAISATFNDGYCRHVGSTTAKLKWDWAGCVSQMHLEKWAIIVTPWVPEDGRNNEAVREDVLALRSCWKLLGGKNDLYT